jgi:hypothetical protein
MTPAPRFPTGILPMRLTAALLRLQLRLTRGARRTL